MIMPITEPQAGWLEAFNVIADAKQENILINVTNTFDEDEWTG